MELFTNLFWNLSIQKSFQYTEQYLNPRKFLEKIKALNHKIFPCKIYNLLRCINIEGIFIEPDT